MVSVQHCWVTLLFWHFFQRLVRGWIHQELTEMNTHVQYNYNHKTHLFLRSLMCLRIIHQHITEIRACGWNLGRSHRFKSRREGGFIVFWVINHPLAFKRTSHWLNNHKNTAPRNHMFSQTLFDLTLECIWLKHVQYRLSRCIIKSRMKILHTKNPVKLPTVPSLKLRASHS